MSPAELRHLADAAMRGDREAALNVAMEIRFGAVEDMVGFIAQGKPVSEQAFDAIADAFNDARELHGVRTG